MQREFIHTEGLGFGVVVGDHGVFLEVEFGHIPEIVVLERSEVESVGFIEEDTDEGSTS